MIIHERRLKIGLDMKKWVMLIPLILFISCLFPYPKGVTFKISGTDGLPFSGCYGNISTTISVDGTVPASYDTELEDEYDVVSGVFQKDEGKNGGRS